MKYKQKRQEERRQEAVQRLKDRESRSNEDQLALLDERPGASKRERERLAG